MRVNSVFAVYHEPWPLISHETCVCVEQAANIALQAQVQKLEDEQRRRHEQLQASSIAGKDGENGSPKSRACVLM